MRKTSIAFTAVVGLGGMAPLGASISAAPLTAIASTDALGRSPVQQTDWYGSPRREYGRHDEGHRRSEQSWHRRGYNNGHNRYGSNGYRNGYYR
jgi:hypothetical protein